jgi:glycosyltransferase involved in cell wall biosynthesis
VDAVFTTKEYDALACILDSVTKKMKHIFFTHGDTINCEKFLTKNARSISRRIKSRIMLLYYPWLQRIILKQLSHVVVQAKFLADTLQHRHPGLDCKYIVLTSDCVFTYPAEKPNVRHLKVLDELKKKDKFIIGTIAQVFYKAKGFNIFLDAMSELRSLPNIHAVIAGYGDEADLIPQNIERLGLENIVTYLGKSPAANQLMPKIDVIVSPTQFFDAFPTVILEALDADCCIVASDIEAHKSQLNDDLLLFENSNHIQLAEKLKRLYDDHGFRNKNREIVQIRKKIFEFDWDAKVVDIFESRILG